jgi:hypothetical protein
MKILLTEHAKVQMVARGITMEQIKIAIQRGSTIKQTNGYLSSFTYILVAWKMWNGYHKVKTVMIRK